MNIYMLSSVSLMPPKPIELFTQIMCKAVLSVGNHTGIILLSGAALMSQRTLNYSSGSLLLGNYLYSHGLFYRLPMMPLFKDV